MLNFVDFLHCQNINDQRDTTKRIGELISTPLTPAATMKRQFFVRQSFLHIFKLNYILLTKYINLFSRAEFDYDPTKDPSLPGVRGIGFRKGDLLHVINAADDSVNKSLIKVFSR